MAKIKFHKICIRSKRLEIRPYKSSDFHTWADVRLNRLEKQNEFDRGPLKPKTISKKWFLNWMKNAKNAAKNDSAYIFGIFDRRTGVNFGVLDITITCRLRYQFANLGYSLNNQFWGKGIATEAVKTSIPSLLKILKLHRFEAGIEPHNFASIKVAKKAGMRFEGKRKRFFFEGKKWVDLDYYIVVADDLKIKMKPQIRPALEEFLRN
jgi:[ribosomal protein S5]-alanine N-acetyltransferase